MTTFDDDTPETDAPAGEADDDAGSAAEPGPETDVPVSGEEAERLAVLGTVDPVAATAADEPEADADADVVAFLTQKDDEPAAEEPEPPAAEEAGSGEAEAEEVEEAEPYDNPWLRPGRWYVVHTQSGYEKKVQQNLQARTQSMNMEDAIYEVVIPMEDVPEFKQGKKVIVQKKVFPGYLLVRCNLTDDSWFVIRNTPGVTGFVGHGNKPTPLPRRDVESFLSVKKEGEESSTSKRTKPRLEYEINETVRVKEGPFADFSGEIVEINEDQLKVKVLVNIFGRETPVELEFSQVAKL